MKEQNKKRLDTMLFFTVLALVAAMFIALCVGFVDFDNIPASARVEEGGIIASVTHESDIKLSQAVSASSNSIEVTATVAPESSITGLDWTLAFANPDSTWASGKNVSDYVTVSVDADERGASLTCHQAFGEQIILTVSADLDSTVYATCNVEYAKKFVGFSNVDIEASSVNTTPQKNGNKITANNVYSFGTFISSMGSRGPFYQVFSFSNIANYSIFTKDANFTFKTYIKASSALAAYYPNATNYIESALNQYGLVCALSGAEMYQTDSMASGTFLYVRDADEQGYAYNPLNQNLLNEVANNLRACNGSFITIKIEVLCDGVVVDTIERELTLDVNSLPAGVSDVSLSASEVVF